MFLAADEDHTGIRVVGDPDRGQVIAVGVGDALDVLVADVDQQAGEQGLLEVFQGGVRRHFGEGMGGTEIELGLILAGLGPVERKSTTFSISRATVARILRANPTSLTADTAGDDHAPTAAAKAANR